MKKESVDYTEALALKELGFDEPCLAGYKKELLTDDGRVLNNIFILYGGHVNYNIGDEVISAPLKSQAFRWFREKYDLNSLVVFDKYICEIDDKELENPYFTYYYSINELWSEGKDYGKFTRGFINVANNRDMLSYEEAELSCLKKLIEIVKQK